MEAIGGSCYTDICGQMISIMMTLLSIHVTSGAEYLMTVCKNNRWKVYGKQYWFTKILIFSPLPKEPKHLAWDLEWFAKDCQIIQGGFTSVIYR